MTQADAHAWVEIYFADYGWVEFEPTAGRAAINRDQESNRSDGSSSASGAQTDTLPGGAARGNDWMIWLAGLFALALGGTGALAYDEWRLRRMKPAGTVNAIYRRMMGQARGLRVDARPALTPYQMNTAIAARLDVLANASRRSSDERSARARAARDARSYLSRLSELYVKTLYSPDRPDEMAQARAIQEWGQLRALLWRARWWQLFEKRTRKSANKPM